MNNSIKQIFLGLMVCLTVSCAPYFSDMNAVKDSKILVGGGLRQEGLGLTFERKIQGNIVADGSVGFFPVDGIHGSLGINSIWKQDNRFRPLLRVGTSYVGGAGPTKSKVVSSFFRKIVQAP